MVRLPGKFVWFEHFSNDVDQARRFYEAFVDWRVTAMPIGLEFYHLALNGKDALGGFRQMPPGGRPGWVGYLSVDNVDESCAAAQAAGARVLLAPTSFPPMGRGAWLVDPTGGVFSIWTAALGDRPDVTPLPAGDWCWNELVTPDPETALAFYRRVFGYESRPVPRPQGGVYTRLLADGIERAGIVACPLPDMPAHWVPFLNVPSVDTMLERADALGAKIIVPARTVQGIGRYGMVQDPTGATVAVFCPAA